MAGWRREADDQVMTRLPPSKTVASSGGTQEPLPRGKARRTGPGRRRSGAIWGALLGAVLVLLLILYGCYLAQRIASSWCWACG